MDSVPPCGGIGRTGVELPGPPDRPHGAEARQCLPGEGAGSRATGEAWDQAGTRIRTGEELDKVARPAGAGSMARTVGMLVKSVGIPWGKKWHCAVAGWQEVRHWSGRTTPSRPSVVASPVGSRSRLRTHPLRGFGCCKAVVGIMIAGLVSRAPVCRAAAKQEGENRGPSIRAIGCQVGDGRVPGNSSPRGEAARDTVAPEDENVGRTSGSGERTVGRPEDCHARGAGGSRRVSVGSSDVGHPGGPGLPSASDAESSAGVWSGAGRPSGSCSGTFGFG